MAKTMSTHVPCRIKAIGIGGGVAAIGYWGESRDIGPSIFPLRMAVPIVSSLFIAAAIILVKLWRGTHLCSTSGKDNPVPT